jgi:hypothetical protein
MLQVGAHCAQDFRLEVIGRRQRHVAALGGQRNPTARAIGNAGGNPETGPGSKHRQRLARIDLTPAEMQQRVVAQMRQGPRKRLEVVKEQDIGRAELLPKFGARDVSGTVGQADATAIHAAGDGKRGALDPRRARLLQIQRQRLACLRVLGHAHDAHIAQRSPGHQAKAHMRAADGAQQDHAGMLGRNAREREAHERCAAARRGARDCQAVRATS